MIVTRLRLALLAGLLLCLAGCGTSPGDVVDGSSGGGSGVDANGPDAAARLLTQATFGPTMADIVRVGEMSAEDYVDEQIAIPPTLHQPQCFALIDRNGTGSQARGARTDVWWKTSLTAPDQLRQRVAFALSEIMVVSDVSSALDGGGQEGLCLYYDILLRHAFGNYRELLEDVTLSPVMGRYLSMLGNRKPDPSVGRRSDENFGREVMQLFSIGLAQLNQDGTVKRDSAGVPLASYTQADIENQARALTGWTWGGASSFSSGTRNFLEPMKPFDSEHDTNSKTLVGNVAVPAGGTARTDLKIALDALAQHENVGPFIGKQLIQKLVTSNPSPAYIGRVAAAFRNDGRGVRGNMAAVIRAILLDPEARNAPEANSTFGKVREPVLRQTHLWRALSAVPAASGRYAYRNARGDLGQEALSSPSVFNFFSPFYSPQGELRTAGLVAPELQLATESSVPVAANRVATSVFTDYVGRTNGNADAIRVDLSALSAKAAKVDDLLDAVDLLFMAGSMDTSFRQTLAAHLNTISAADGGRARVQEAVYLVMTSQQYLFQR